MALYKKTIALFFLLLVTFSGAIGQELLRVGSTAASVQTQVTVIPPYPFHFQGLIRQQGNAVTLQNLSGSPLQLKLHFKMVSVDGNVSIETRPGVRPSQPINLAPHGGLRLGFAQLGELLSPSQLLVAGIRSEDLVSSQPMPEGYYTICITPENYNDPTVLGREACSVTFPMMSIEPPTLRLTNFLINDTVQQVSPQHLVFQWNTPSNLNLGLLGSIKTTLKLVEVPKGMMPEQAMLNAPYYSPRFEVKGQNLFIYGPTQSPLVKGRRYAAVIQMTDPQNRVSFRNNGTSEIISFVFGKAASNDIENQASRLQGSVQWAYKASEEEQNISNTPLVSATPLEEKVQLLDKENDPGKKTYSLAGALVEVYGCNTPNLKNGKSIVGSAKTDDEGNYNMALILRQSMQKFKYLVVAISHPSGLFSKTEKVLDYNAVVNDYTLGNTVLLGQTLELTPRVILADGTLNNQVSLNILLPEKEWGKYELLSQAGFGKDKHKIFYNNQFYTIVTTLHSGNVFKHLFQTIHPNEHYLVQVNYPNRPSAYYPLDEVYYPSSDLNDNKPVMAISKNYGYDNTNAISGKITFKGAPRWDVRISIAFNPEEVVGKYNASNTYSTVSDNNGEYSIKGLPNLRKGAKIKVSLVDKTIRSVALIDELVINKNGDLKKDYEIAPKALQISGHVTDRQGNVLENVWVTLGETNKTTYTDNNGDYNLTIESSELDNNLTLLADGYVQQAQGLQKAVEMVRKQSKNNTTTTWAASLGTTIMDKIPNKSSFDLEVLRLIDNAKITEGKVVITPVSGMSKATVVDWKTIKSGTYTYEVGDNLDPSGYYVSFQPSEKQEKELSHAVAIVPLSLNQEHVNVQLKAGTNVVITGTVKYQTSKSPLANQLVIGSDKVGGITTNYTATTDKSGKFQIIARINSTVRLQTDKTGYIAKDTSFDVTTNDVSVTFLMGSSVGLNFTKLAGFPLTITQITAISGSTNQYSIKGVINLAGRDNNVFTLTGGTQLTLDNAKVIADPTNPTVNAIPINKDSIIILKNPGAPVTLKGFNFAPVQLSNTSNIQLKLISTSSSNGYIYGRLDLKPVMPSGVTYQLPNAILKDDIAKTGYLATSFMYADGTQPSNTFNIGFDTTTSGTAKMALMQNITLNLKSATLSTSGITGLVGNLALDSILSFTKDNIKTVAIQSGAFKTDFSFQTLRFYNSGNTILSGSFQKVKAYFSDIVIKGVGTANANAVFVGKMSLVKGGVDIPFSQMSMVNNGSYYSMASSLTAIKSGITIGSMNFEMQATATNATFNYTASNNTYNIYFPLSFNMAMVAGITSAPAVNQIVQAIFPSPIKGQFNLQTANFGVFVAANPNQKVELKAVEISLNSLLFNMGTNANLESMDSIMLGTKSASAPIAFDTTQVDGSSAFWAFGISGDVAFSKVNSMTGRGAAYGGGGIVLVAQTALGFAARVNNLYMQIETGTMKVNANLVMIFDYVKQGFEGTVSMEMKGMPMVPKKASPLNNKGFEAYFKYYSYTDGTFNVGCSLTVNADIDCGPVRFYSFGGGFDLDTKYKIYKVFVTGSLGPIGIPSTVIKVDAKLELEFSSACNYIPIVKGTGSTIVGSVLNVADMAMTLDFCNRYCLMQIVKKISLPGPLGDADISSTLFIAAPSSGSNGCFFLQANIKVAVVGISLGANGGFGIGWNVKASNPYLPASSTNMLTVFVGDGTLNGLYLYGIIDARYQDTYGISTGFIDASFSWNLAANFSCTFYADFQGGNINLNAALGVELGGSAKAQFLGYGPSLGGLLKLQLAGSANYNPSTGFVLVGSGSARMEIFGGITTSGINNSCNSFSFEFYELCVDCGFFTVCVPIPCGASAKACFGLAFDYKIKSGGGHSVSFKL